LEVFQNDALAFAGKNPRPAGEIGNGQLAADKILP